MFVRPEEIGIVAGAGGENVLLGTVAAHSYQGSFTHVVVDAPGLPPVMVSVPGGDVVAAYPPGAPVRLQLDLAQASILPV